MHTPLNDTHMKLKVGKISYTNLFPVFYTLQKEHDCSNYEFFEGSPSELNRTIREGRIDISPSSSIEFLRYPEGYDLIKNHSISSAGPIGSIILFSRRPIEYLHGFTVLTTTQSETSVALLHIVLRKFLGIECHFDTTAAPLEKALTSHTACLLIGDKALIESRKWKELHQYDLAEIWHRETGLPFTFALWIARKNPGGKLAQLLEAFRHDLDSAKTVALSRLNRIAGASPLGKILPGAEIVSYWKRISYDLGPAHRKGLDLFRRYSSELGLLRK